MMKRLMIIVLALCSITAFAGESNEIIVVCAGGYKQPVKEIIEYYEEQSSQKVNAVFGNMNMIINYCRQTDKVALIIGDMDFIQKAGIELDNEYKIGNGKLVLVYQDDLNLKNVEELQRVEIERIGIPDPKKAIYGRAAVEYLKSKGVYDGIVSKIIILKTVPQVSAYLKSGTIDAGLINITDYIKIKNSKLRMIELDDKLYSPITIEAGLIDKSAEAFYNFLSSSTAKNVFEKYGL